MNLDWNDTPDPFDDPYAPDDGVRCARCKAEGLTWQRRDQHWVLVEANGELHVCAQFNQSTGNFEALK